MTRRELAQQLAKQAGEMMLAEFRSESNGIQNKTDMELVTDLDKKIDAMIRVKISEMFPDDDLVTEEGDFKDNPGNHRWYVDPIDGTDNFIWGIPFFCVSIACEDAEGLVCGVVYDPNHNELFVAERGTGAFLNTQPIHVSDRAPDKLTLRMVGRGYGEKPHAENRVLSQKLDSLFEKRRDLGTAALMLCYVAVGRAETCLLTDTNAWDAAAGALIVQEAGGVVSDFAGETWDTSKRYVIASNAEVHDQTVQIAQEIL